MMPIVSGILAVHPALPREGGVRVRASEGKIEFPTALQGLDSMSWDTLE
jgi:hypothetical protein